MATYTYHLSGDPRRALDTALKVLGDQKYTVSKDSEWSATAEVGSTGKVALFGAFSPHVRLGVTVATNPDGAVLRLVQSTTGVAGGLIGMSKVKKAVKAAGEGVQQALQSEGTLASVHVA